RHEGGCLCGAVRYAASAAPVRTTICHCTFCQRLTGSAFLVEPIFARDAVEFRGATPARYAHRSDGSGKQVGVNFCAACGTVLFLDFELFPDVLGLCGGTFDNPNWFDRDANTCRHIFIRSAQRGVVLPAGVPLYEAHAIEPDGSPNPARVL